jgi:hypothetical protein
MAILAKRGTADLQANVLLPAIERLEAILPRASSRSLHPTHCVFLIRNRQTGEPSLSWPCIGSQLHESHAHPAGFSGFLGGSSWVPNCSTWNTGSKTGDGQYDESLGTANLQGEFCCLRASHSSTRVISTTCGEVRFPDQRTDKRVSQISPPLHLEPVIPMPSSASRFLQWAHMGPNCSTWNTVQEQGWPF